MQCRRLRARCIVGTSSLLWLLLAGPAFATTPPAPIEATLQVVTPLIRVGEAIPIAITVVSRVATAQVLAMAVTVGPGLAVTSPSLDVAEGGNIDLTTREMAFGAQRLEGTVELPATDARQLTLRLIPLGTLPTHSMVQVQVRPIDETDSAARATSATLFISRTTGREQLVIYRPHELNVGVDRATVRTAAGSSIPLLTNPNALVAIPAGSARPSGGAPQRTVIADLDQAPERAPLPALVPMTVYQEQGLAPTPAGGGTELPPPYLVTP
ncbi:MAG: hypothetical protein HY696_08635 [Deltaproteobacteria bacterium]|nr:hypothetical protein [Deltaproteobacteria bacterium]